MRTFVWPNCESGANKGQIWPYLRKAYHIKPWWLRWSGFAKPGSDSVSTWHLLVIIYTVRLQEESIGRVTSAYIDNVYVKAKLIQYELMCKDPECLGITCLDWKSKESVTLCGGRGDVRHQISLIWYPLWIGGVSSHYADSWWNISPCVNGCVWQVSLSGGANAVTKGMWWPSWWHCPQVKCEGNRGQCDKKILPGVNGV